MKDKIQFTFSNKTFKVGEILENLNISMWWTWKNEVCPHCKKKIEKRELHNFYKIEILIPIDLSPENSKKEDIILLGYDKKGRKMLLTEDKINEVLTKSEKFKHIVGGNNNGH